MNRVVQTGFTWAARAHATTVREACGQERRVRTPAFVCVCVVSRVSPRAYRRIQFHLYTYTTFIHYIQYTQHTYRT